MLHPGSSGYTRFTNPHAYFNDVLSVECDAIKTSRDSQASSCNAIAFHQEEADIQSAAGATDAAKQTEEGRRVVVVVVGEKKKSSMVVIFSVVSCARVSNVQNK